MADAPQALRIGLERRKDRVRVGLDLGFEHEFSFLVDDADRGLFHRHVQSGKILRGCPPWALGALSRPRISTVILEDSRLPRCEFQKLRSKPNYAGSPAPRPTGFAVITGPLKRRGAKGCSRKPVGFKSWTRWVNPKHAKILEKINELALAKSFGMEYNPAFADL